MKNKSEDILQELQDIIDNPSSPKIQNQGVTEEVKNSKPESLKYFLVSTGDRGNREDCSIFYCILVIAVNETEALNKYVRKYYNKRVQAVGESFVIKENDYIAVEMKNPLF